MARQQMQQQNPQYADNPMILNIIEQQVGQQLVQQQILLPRRPSWASRHQTTDVAAISCTRASWRRSSFPTASTSATTQYAASSRSRFNMSVAEFEDEHQARHRHSRGCRR